MTRLRKASLIRDLLECVQRFAGEDAPAPWPFELEAQVLIRYSRAEDRAALERLAAPDSRVLPE